MYTVTTFGTCRTDAIDRVANHTTIRDRLTRPSYSSEVLQAIRFVKGSFSPSTFNLFSFRNSAFVYRHEFKKLFETTDIFIVEISTQRALRNADGFAHYHADFVYRDIMRSNEDLDDLLSYFESSEFKEYKEPLGTVRRNIQHIIQELSPKPVIFQTHLYHAGMFGLEKRLAFINTLKEIFEEYGAHYIEPGKVLEEYQVAEVYKDDDHLTPKGEEILADAYLKLITDILKPVKEG